MEKKKSKFIRESLILTAIEFVEGKKSKPKQLTWKVNVLKWNGFISLDCVWEYSFCVCYPITKAGICTSVWHFSSSATAAAVAVNAMNIHYLQNQMHHVTPCYVRIPYVRIQFSRANLTSHSSGVFLFCFLSHLFFCSNPLWRVCVFCTRPHPGPFKLCRSNSTNVLKHSKTNKPFHFFEHISNIGTIYCIKLCEQREKQCVHWSGFPSPRDLSRFARISFWYTHIQNLILILFASSESCSVASQLSAIYSNRFIQIK